MAATAAALSTYIQVREPATKLKQLTNFESSATATTINTTTLEAFCTTAINSFQSQLTVYNPDLYPAHYDIAWYMAIALLEDMVGNIEKGDEYRKKADALIPGLQKRRTLYPQSNSTTEPTARTTDISPFDDTIFSKVIPN